MAPDKVFRVRLTQQELEKLDRNSEHRGIKEWGIDSGLYQEVAELAQLRDIESRRLARGVHVVAELSRSCC